MLIVEDDAVIRAATSEFLAQAGYKVLTAINGRDALEKVHTGGAKIHLVITDLLMPEMNGRQLAEAVAATWPETKVLFISGDPQLSGANKGDLAKQNFLQKPFSLSVLGNKVREVLAEPLRSAGASAD